jgi:hypothetical protein
MQQAAQTALTNFGGVAGGALSQYGMYQGLMAGQRGPSPSYNPMNDPELYAIPATNTSELGPTSTSLFPEYGSSIYGR